MQVPAMETRTHTAQRPRTVMEEQVFSLALRPLFFRQNYADQEDM